MATEDPSVEGKASSIELKKSSNRRRKGLPPASSSASSPPLASDDTKPIKRFISNLRHVELPKEHQHRSEVTQLWLKSRLTAPTLTSNEAKFRVKGEERPINSVNLAIALRLILLLWTRFLALFFWGDNKIRVVGFLLGRVVKGVLPAARIWASSWMLDIVQESFEDKVINTREVLRVAAISLFFAASEDIFNFICSDNDSFVRTHTNYTMEKSYLRSQLSLSIPSLSSPFLSALMYEAGVFAGFESRITPNGPRGHSGGPFQTLQSAFGVLTISIEVISQAVLLIRTLASVPETTEITSSSIILITLSFAPSILRLVGTWLGHGKRGIAGRMNWHQSRERERAIKDMGRNGSYKQEVVLYGLKDWILHRWEELKIKQLEEQAKNRQNTQAINLGLGLGQEGIQTAFYVLLAVRALNTSLSLGSIRLYQSTATSLLRSVQLFTHTLGETFQSIFYLAAFLEATDDPESQEMIFRRGLDGAGELDFIDYETVRVEGGMKIQAQNLSFTYPGSEKPVLRNVNLQINPGETLAIVGFNGGGKSTLVKVLMGLYDHEGTLLINDIPAKSFLPASLHQRTSCLFQDFSRYTLTLKENVGVGLVSRMDDEEAIREAITKGGAQGVLEKVGMEGWLDRRGVPDASGENGVGAQEAGNTGEDPSAQSRLGPPAWPSRGQGGPRRGGGRIGGLMDGGPQRSRLAKGPPPGIPLPPPDGLPPEGMIGPPPDLGSSIKETKEAQSALSGGQWQRVALSRAFLRSDEADLVVFDEPSASLDPRAESELFQRIHALSHQNERKTTTIYISHRFSTVRRADQIAVVEDGTISEIGSHDDLMALQGRYFELFNLQKEGFA